MNQIIPFFSMLLLAGHAAGGTVKLDDCPPAVRTTIQQNQRDGRIEEIESHTIEGRTLYVAEIELAGGRDLKLHVGADGTLVKTREEVQTTDLPEPVRKTVDSKLADGRIDDVEKETAGESVIWQVEIDRPNARDLALAIDPTGKILSEAEEADD